MLAFERCLLTRLVFTRRELLTRRRLEIGSAPAVRRVTWQTWVYDKKKFRAIKREMLALEAPERGGWASLRLGRLVHAGLQRACADFGNKTLRHKYALGWGAGLGGLPLSFFLAFGEGVWRGTGRPWAMDRPARTVAPRPACTFDECFFCAPAAGRGFVFRRRVLLVLAAGRSSRVSGNKKYGWGLMGWVITDQGREKFVQDIHVFGVGWCRGEVVCGCGWRLGCLFSQDQQACCPP